MHINSAFSRNVNHLQSPQQFEHSDASLRTVDVSEETEQRASDVVELSQSAQEELARLQNRSVEETDPSPLAELGLLAAESANDDKAESAAKRGIDVGSHDHGVRGARGRGAERGVRQAYGLRAQLESTGEVSSEEIAAPVPQSLAQEFALPINGEAPIAEQERDQPITAADIPPTQEDDDESSTEQTSYTPTSSALTSYEQFGLAA